MKPFVTVRALMGLVWKVVGIHVPACISHIVCSCSRDRASFDVLEGSRDDHGRHCDCIMGEILGTAIYN